jgi:multidrug resistance efflux pump
MAQVEDRPRQAEAQAEAAQVAPTNGHVPEPSPPPARRGLPKPPGLPILLALALAIGTLAALYWHEQAAYVSTDTAMVQGIPVFVSSPAGGQIQRVNVNVGDEVAEGQVLAVVTLGFGPSAIFVPVRSPMDGIIVARAANPGDTVSSGRSDSSQSSTRPIVTLVDPSDLWIEAEIDESQVGQVRLGQPAEVTVTSLGQVLNGRVVSIGRATTEASAQLRQGNVGGSGNASRSTPLVPVRIQVDYGDLPLFVGASASVRIRVQE